MKLEPGTHEDPDKGYRSRYSHDKEWASPIIMLWNWQTME